MSHVLIFLKKYAVYLAFLQAWGATLGSLYFSEIRGFAPCPLCWYQRILMYPLIFILTVAIIRKDKNVAYYVLPMSILGVIIALYQYLLQMGTAIKNIPIQCDAFGSCEQIEIIYFGFITIPFLSLAAFVIITFLMIIGLLANNKNEH
ncbi:MAG: Protein disulfide oxidoreductase [Candidatus Curtissbacteria bacterium GW2011_GWC2_38_9]|uniref:2-oxoglutarate dehydrogenase n=3 Tax=Candidatus Curtissiibacteriota TaxID=1752717 RepID=A0A1F5HUS2_9BACT|nr:MAG: Protein disulfide oxidoreductase [Candidatus Curtissbacteria bacterium GW2011_GWC2_38_9]KKS05063.1 MAG: Protein disulfide oxidoreductase [Candidatus Curtissbacteria bacterium GW2011_GWA2_41_24]OGD90631.1 MAG: hypothetical protein A2Z54_01560 [Candidatus Curtissbacteria bacterium RIFCSPHIGHO2_02_39_8]OGE07911.1 MAG: hypothetical protein A2W70_00465 [Candidatus Curtissbacteria bacterium RIFCSPLOWO2_02_41_11]